MIYGFTEGRPYAEELNKRGYSAFVLYYRCKKEGLYPAPQQDVARALNDTMTDMLWEGLGALIYVVIFMIDKGKHPDILCR